MKWVFVLMVVAMPAWTGSIYKCTQPDGSVTFSNIDCPEDTVARENKGQTGPAFQGSGDAYNPYSLTEQARRIDERNRAYKRARSRAREQDRYIPSTTRRPAMSYEAARRLGMEECGYREYGRLSKSQKRCMHEEMAKYDHGSPRESAVPVESEDERMEREQIARNERKREIKRVYEVETRWRELGVQGRERKFNDAVRDCKDTFMANCW